MTNTSSRVIGVLRSPLKLVTRNVITETGRASRPLVETNRM